MRLHTKSSQNLVLAYRELFAHPGSPTFWHGWQFSMMALIVKII